MISGGIGIYFSKRVKNVQASIDSGKAAGGSQENVQAKVFGVEKVRFSDSISGLIGTVKGETIELAFGGVEEKIIAAHVQVGQVVPRGEKLFELDHVRGEAKKNQAEIALERVRQLQAVGGATANDVKEAQSTLDVAKKDYEDTFVFAPKAGYISDIRKRIGETSSRNEAIASLVSTEDRFYIETGVVEGQIDQVQKGQSAIVEIDAYGDHKLHGNVLGVSREVTVTGQTGTVLIGLPDYVQSKVRPGLSARCSITIFDRPTLVIPRQAYEVKKEGVYVVGADKKTVFKPVELGHATRDHLEIKKGLKAGDRILYDLLASPIEEGTSIASFGEDEHFKNP
jgi:multidrug efflux pump subunit AcrA (membrane-fusion protein)